ncbi:hypothetical protein DFH06DRAFT_1013158 [Mycena polygramma]|nr:hypothetical protein DFH06DRAFT_1013158 [Mycena polygramma]
MDEDDTGDADLSSASPRKRACALRSPEKRHRVARASQTDVWMNVVIPDLVSVFMDLYHKTRSWRNMDALGVPTEDACLCLTDGALLKVTVLTFTDMYDVDITPCRCRSAPRQLLERGLFPSAPVRPGVAVDVRLLEFTKKLFVRIAPNKSAMVGALQDHLADLGFKLPSDDGMRRQFAASLEWYTHLRHRADARIDQVLEATRKYGMSTAEPAPDGTPPGTPHPPHGAGIDSPPPPMPPPPPTPTPAAGKKRKRDTTPEDPNPFPPAEARDRPSEYLRARCPACFGGDLPPDTDRSPQIKVCVDACFTQSKNKSVPDPPKTHPRTHFVPEEQSQLMEKFVDGVRGTGKAKKPAKRPRASVEEEEEEVQLGEEEDGYEHPELRLPRSVLNSCEASFKAADEKREKASTKMHDDTALMALLCRHDRVLWIVNMHSAGEKQFPVLLLIKTLYQHLPLWVVVGLLYDVACQLERSARKWGFLAKYLDRLIFAVAVFHAFGHDWPCQLLYHPRKCKGFGFTNGEGCKRFWHSISHLIAHLRVSSYHHRLYTLDTQVKHSDEGNLFRLGEWNKRRSLHSADKRAAAEEVIAECGVSLEVLEEEWKKQIVAQTKPLPRRSKNMAKKAIEVVMALRDAAGIKREQLQACQKAVLAAIEVGDSDRIQESKADLRTAKQELGKAEKRLENKERALGVAERAQLADLKTTKYLELRMRGRALKHRLRDRLRARKFELDRVERSARRQLTSEKKLGSHTLSAIKKREPSISKLYKDYNKTCAAIAKLIKSRAAPKSAIAPQPIDEKKVWELDVDDGIWQDVGLDDDDDEGAAAPLWLSNDPVRKGIPAMLDLQRADEEDRELAKERRAMQMWFSEEWKIVNVAMERADTEGLRYSLHLRRERLLRLCATWRRSIGDDDGTPEWGPTTAELLAVRLEQQTAGRGEDHYTSAMDAEGDDYESGSEANSEDIEVLDALDTADAYRGIYEDSDEDSSEE